MTAKLAHAGYVVVAIARKQSTELARLKGEHRGKLRFIAWDLGENSSLGERARKCASFMAGSGVWLITPASVRRVCCRPCRTAG
jgi:short-subunit dehydrogenase